MSCTLNELQAERRLGLMRVAGTEMGFRALCLTSQACHMEVQ